jgi:3-isopropylmalate/(R)-2-methylmalate dehydratase small subunit
LFDELRYLDPYDETNPTGSRQVNPDFTLNQARYEGATILLGRENFGCGSSREHAVWALDQFGIKCVIAPSFADIFKNNAFKSGLLPVELPESEIDALFERIASDETLRLRVDLVEEQVRVDPSRSVSFSVDPFRRNCLLEGLDDIGITLQREEAISRFEAQHKQSKPWLFNEVNL